MQFIICWVFYLKLSSRNCSKVILGKLAPILLDWSEIIWHQTKKTEATRANLLKCKIQFRQKFKFCTFFLSSFTKMLFWGQLPMPMRDEKRALRLSSRQGGLKKSVPLLRYYISWPVSVNLVPCMGLKNGIEFRIFFSTKGRELGGGVKDHLLSLAFKTNRS